MENTKIDISCSCGHCHSTEKEGHTHSAHSHDHAEINEKAGFFEKYELPLLLAGGALFLASFFLKSRRPLFLTFTLAAYLILGWDVVWKSLSHIRSGNFLDENFLMTIATFGAFYLGEVSEAAGVMLFYKIGEYFQEKAVARAKGSIESLMGIKSLVARILTPEGNTREVDPDDVAVGSRLLIRAGERIPIDGVVVRGAGVLDVSALTGESIPLDVKIGDSVLSGSINGNSVLEVTTSKLFEDSAVSRIIEMVQNSTQRKAKAEKFITKFARYYTPVVVGLALIVAFLLPLLFGNFRLWFERGLIFLVISCPCALVISIPLSFFSAIGLASRRGILIKGGNYLEKMTELDAAVFDKTGTLTRGEFRIDRIEPLGCPASELITVAKIGEFHSTHPVSAAVHAYQSADLGPVNEAAITSYQEIPGQGTVVEYGGSVIAIGNKKLLSALGTPDPGIQETGTVLYVVRDKILLGMLHISDEIRPDTAFAVGALRKRGISPYMLTGDTREIAEAVGEKIGLPKENIYSRLLPEDKVRILSEIKAKSKKGVLFAGDGINDAPSLAMADVSVAMGGRGTDIAIESADVVLMKDEPSKIITLLQIAEGNKNIVIQNIVLALGIKGVIMVLGVIGVANMWLAIFADVGVAMLAVLNAIRPGFRGPSQT